MAEQSKIPHLGAHEIRRRFVEFFRAREHAHVPSSSLVPHADPSLLFVNAGMVQFKDVFLGREKRPYTRAVSVQRCLRAGGKHNDLDNVGFTPIHHTLFEMLGNFSFGDYFKREAIRWGWEFLTSPVEQGGLGLPPRRLVVTVFNGEGEAAPADDEAYALWTELVPRERIYRCDAKENFWMMGDTGPCGPCSEIHIFAGDEAPGDALREGDFGPAHEEDRYTELWNLVFMQYEKHEDGSLTPLPKPSVDTGAGLERVAAIVAGTSDNYQTDLLRPLVEEAARLAQRDPDEGPAFRVIADHARATAFLVADGVFPDRAGRSYVLRRIMRRAIRHGTEAGLDEPFLHRICRKVVDMFGDVYPELRERAPTIEEVVRGEELAFRRTLSRGLRRLDAVLEELQSGETLPAEVAADLYDTYGFPLDLTGVICRERGIALDEKAAEAEVKRRQAGGTGNKVELGQEQAIADVYFELHERVGDTEFLGYDTTAIGARALALVSGSEPVEQVEAGGAVEIVFDRTPFYGEAGGQIGDSGEARGESVRIRIDDVQRPRDGLLVHRGRVLEGVVRKGDRLELAIDVERRAAIRRNHSATHLLHDALRKVLGPHVLQKGSLVAPDRLRFDFSHSRPLSAQERHEIEEIINREILVNHESSVQVMGVDQAKQAGAIGLFGEKYGQQVRVVTIGRESIELCGGTHVSRTGDIGSFAIVAEGGIAQGVRRIEAVTGMGAVRYLQGLVDTVESAASHLHAADVHEVPERIARLQADLKQKDREMARLQTKLATGAKDEADQVQDVEGIKLMAKRVPVADSKRLREAADALRHKLGSGVVVLGAENDGKATLLVAVTKDLTGRIHAGTLVGELARHVDGRGGGRPDLAQAGGPKAAGLDAAIAAARPAIEGQLHAS